MTEIDWEGKPFMEIDWENPFKAEDFDKQKIWDVKANRWPHDVLLADIAEIANARFRELLKDSPTVFNAPNEARPDIWLEYGETEDEYYLDIQPTKAAKLIGIKKFK